MYFLFYILYNESFVQFLNAVMYDILIIESYSHDFRIMLSEPCEASRQGHLLSLHMESRVQSVIAAKKKN